MKSDVDKLYQITELNKIYIFITNKLFFLKIFRVSKFSLKFFDTEIHNLELSNVIKCWQGPKQVFLNATDIFVIDKFFIWSHLVSQSFRNDHYYIIDFL